MLSERRATYCLIPFICKVQRRQIPRDTRWTVASRGWEKGKWGVTDNDMRLLFGVMECSKIDGVDGCTTL